MSMTLGLINGTAAESELIRRAIAMAPKHTLLWQASTAEDGLRLCRDQLPDLLLLDLSVPDIGGVEATRRIMGHSPCAILIMASNVGRMATEVFEAMGHGALDAVDKPAMDEAHLATCVGPFLAKLEEIDRRFLGGRSGSAAKCAKPATPPMAERVVETLVVIGASAGGPAAVRAVLGGLPPDFPAAVIVVQHMDERFSQGMVDWLSASTCLPVRVCKEGDTPSAGVVLIAGTNDHLVFKSGYRLGYSPEPADFVYRPSVDVFFASVKRYWRQRVVGVILTGMGKDGSVELKALRAMGHHTIVQDRQSSAVYGMPKAAIECGAAAEILPLDQIAQGLVKALSARK